MKKCHLVFDCDFSSAATRQRRHFIIDGPVGSGKSVALAMIVQWARAKGWLVFYIPNGKEWTHGSLYYKNEDTGLVDTPNTAQMALEVRVTCTI